MSEQKQQIEQAKNALEKALSARDQAPKAFVGLDGFIDEIVHVVDQRQDFQNYTPIKTIADYAKRLATAAGKSTNVELVLRQVKMGGNGPLMSDALGRLGTEVCTAGALGKGTLNPTFERLCEQGPVLSLCDPAVTIAAEFEDGKIMHGQLQTLDEITYENLVTAAGGEESLAQTLGGTELLALVNWTMIPRLTEVMEDILKLLEKYSGPTHAFFDFCDPAKRSREDLRRVLGVIGSFTRAVKNPILGLNEKESWEVCDALGIEYGEETADATLARAQRIAETVGIPEVVIHPHTFAVAWTENEQGISWGPYCKAPRLTTGAGDHFNGGYAFARMAGLSPLDAVTIGTAVSGFYVRQGHGPSAAHVAEFCDRWMVDTLDPWRDFRA